jgi:hypothetical protein
LRLFVGRLYSDFPFFFFVAFVAFVRIFIDSGLAIKMGEFD